MRYSPRVVYAISQKTIKMTRKPCLNHTDDFMKWYLENVYRFSSADTTGFRDAGEDCCRRCTSHLWLSRIVDDEKYITTN